MSIMLIGIVLWKAKRPYSPFERKQRKIKKSYIPSFVVFVTLCVAMYALIFIECIGIAGWKALTAQMLIALLLCQYDT